MRTHEAIKATLEEHKHLWADGKPTTLEDLEKSFAVNYPYQYQRDISTIGISVLNKILLGKHDRHAQLDYEDLYKDACADNKHSREVFDNIDLFVKGLGEAAAWSLMDDIDQVIYEEYGNDH